MKTTAERCQLIRREGSRDAVLRGMGLMASILIAIFVLWISGVFTPGPNIIVTTDQRAMPVTAASQQR